MPSRKNPPSPSSPSASNSSSPSSTTSTTSEPRLQNPYTTLSVPPTATQAEIKSAYRLLALRHHPDKSIPLGTPAAEANRKFQAIAFAYSVLGDERRREIFDETGLTSETGQGDGGDGGAFNWAEFYRAQFVEVISEEGIEAFRREYRGSEEERGDVLLAYEEVEGDCEGLFERVMVSDVLLDEERFRHMIEEAIGKGEVKRFKKFGVGGKEWGKQRGKRVKVAKREAEEAEELAKELGVADKLKGKAGKAGNGEEALKALIMQRQKGRAEGFLADLEAKYAPKGKRKAGAVDEPSEDMFAKNVKGGKQAINGDGEETSKKRSKRTKS